MRRFTDEKNSTDEVTYKIVNNEGNNVKLVLNWGEKPTSGYKIKIKNVEVQGEEIIVTYSTVYPAPDAICKQVITYPQDTWEGTLTEAPNKYKIKLSSE